MCKQTFDSSSVHNMYVKRAQRGRGVVYSIFPPAAVGQTLKFCQMPNLPPPSLPPVDFVGEPGPLGGKKQPCHSLNILQSH